MTSNKSFFFSTFLFLFAVVAYFISFPSMVNAEPFVKCAKLCEECHEEEFKVW